MILTKRRLFNIQVYIYSYFTKNTQFNCSNQTKLNSEGTINLTILVEKNI